jgi:membrane protein implicated in regulation of membrane protease activity
MSRIESQLREYFDAGVERITADDVFARARVEERGLERLHTATARPSLRPAWVAVGTFVATLLIIGGFAALLKAAPEISDADVGSARIVEADGGTLGFWTIAALVAAVVAGAAVWATRRRRTESGADDPEAEVHERKVTVMDTIERTDERADAAQHRSRWPVILSVVLAVALVATLLWMALAMRPNSPNAASPEIVDLMDEYTAAWNAHDVEALAPLVTIDYRIHSRVPGFDYGLDELEGSLMPQLADWSWHTTSPEAYYAVETAAGRWAVSSEGSVISRAGDEYSTNGLWLLFKSEDGFKVAEHYFFGG